MQACREEEEAWTGNVKRQQDFSDPNRLWGCKDFLKYCQRGIRTRQWGKDYTVSGSDLQKYTMQLWNTNRNWSYQQIGKQRDSWRANNIWVKLAVKIRGNFTLNSNLFLKFFPVDVVGWWIILTIFVNWCNILKGSMPVFINLLSIKRANRKCTNFRVKEFLTYMIGYMWAQRSKCCEICRI